MSFIPSPPPAPSATFLWRDFTPGRNYQGAYYDVRRYSWNAIGGPDRATIHVPIFSNGNNANANPQLTNTLQAAAQGAVNYWNQLFAAIGAARNEAILFEHAEFLRCPIEIAYGGLVRWWGYVHEVKIHLGGISIGLSLDSMTNRVRVMWAYNPPELETNTIRLTDWIENSQSIAVYGQKESTVNIGVATESSANQTRDGILAERKFPTPLIEEDNRAPFIELECRGWYHTLDWDFYQNLVDLPVETTTQLLTITAGEFITSARADDASGFATTTFRNGRQTRRQAAEDLLRMGTTNDRRLLATVTRQRQIVIREEPTYTTESAILISRDGTITKPLNDPGSAAGTTPTGWAKLKDGLPGTLDTAYINDPARFFIDWCEWDEANKIHRFTPRGFLFGRNGLGSGEVYSSAYAGATVPAPLTDSNGDPLFDSNGDPLYDA
jgi:hypothetical protein